MGLRSFPHFGVKLKGSGKIFGNSVPLSIDIGAARHGQFIAFAIFESVADRFAAGAAVRTGTGDGCKLNGASVGAKRKWRKRDDNKRNCRR